MPDKGCIAITGSTGYIGGALADCLEKTGHKIVRLGRSQIDSGHSLKWALHSDRDLSCEFRQLNVQTLIHCAYDFEAYGARGERLNIDGSARLLEAFRRIGGHRAILISTMSAFTETRSRYGLTKLAIERLFSGQNECSLRLGLVFGNSPRGMVGVLLKVAGLLRIVLPMVGSGRYRLHLLRMEELCTAVCALVGTTDAPAIQLDPGSVLTVADPQPLEFRDILRRLAASQGLRPKFIPIPWRLVWFSLKLLEIVGIRGRLRADGVIGLVYSNPAPNFDCSALRRLGLTTLADSRESGEPIK